jgi:CheY-like chemotaxis protein
MLQLLLKHRGFTLIDQCENGKEAVDCVSAKGNDYYDLIFLDNLMPTMVSLSIDHPSIIIISVLTAL